MSGVRTAAQRKMYDTERVLPANEWPNVAPDGPAVSTDPVIYGFVRPAVSLPTSDGNRTYSSHQCHVMGEQMTVSILTRYKVGVSSLSPDSPTYAGMVVMPIASEGSPLYCGMLCHNLSSGYSLVYGIVFPTQTGEPVLVMCGCSAQYSDLRRMARKRMVLDYSKMRIHGTVLIPAWPGSLKFGNYCRGDLSNLAQPMVCDKGKVCELTLGQAPVSDKPNVTIRLRLLAYSDGTWQPMEAMASLAVSPRETSCPLLPRVVHFSADVLIEFQNWCIEQQIHQMALVPGPKPIR